MLGTSPGKALLAENWAQIGLHERPSTFPGQPCGSGVDQPEDPEEWDYQHGTVESYHRRGRHIAEFDPHTAEQLKGPNSDYQVEP
jgi:Cytotoxic